MRCCATAMRPASPISAADCGISGRSATATCSPVSTTSRQPRRRTPISCSIPAPTTRAAPTEVAPWFDELAACHAAGLPMVCANPDLEVIRGGARVICAGALALHYAALGGRVLWVGKPDPEVYRPVLALLGLPRARGAGGG